MLHLSPLEKQLIVLSIDYSLSEIITKKVKHIESIEENEDKLYHEDRLETLDFTENKYKEIIKKIKKRVVNSIKKEM